MNPNKRNIPDFSQEVDLKDLEPVTKEKIASRFEEAQDMVIIDLLHHLLQREPKVQDFDSLERVQSMVHDGEDVYYCDIKIGKLIMGGTKDKLESLLAMKDIYIFFIPEEEFALPDEDK
jgi:hypothetical protein